jgi:hypothetical protein
METNQMTKEQVIKHYQAFAEMQPKIFVDYTWSDLINLKVGSDANGLVSEGLVPDLGKEVWGEVVEALSPTFSVAWDKVSRK